MILGPPLLDGGAAQAEVVIAPGGRTAADDVNSKSGGSKKSPGSGAPPAYDWTGFYAGVDAGYSGDAFRLPFGASWTPLELTPPMSVNGAVRLKSSGFAGGAHVGYDYQILGPFVLGVEADIDAAAIDGAGVKSAVIGGAGFSGKLAPQLDYLGTARGRVGYELGAGRSLLYVTGGFAYAGAGREGVLTGWTVGGGLEYALAGNWTLRTEYLYDDLSGARLYSGSVAGSAFGSSGTLRGRAHAEPTVNIVRIGLNYRFGAPGAGAASYPRAPQEASPLSGRQAAFAWTGFHAGANIGVAGDMFNYPSGLTAFDIGLESGSAHIPSSGIIGGGQVGFDYQYDGPLVLGVEADFQRRSAAGSGVGVNGAALGAGFSANIGSRLNWLGTARGRVGDVILENRALIYATGGFAYGGEQSFVNGSVDGLGSFGVSKSAPATGWTAGGGVEYALTDHWTLKTEYLHVNLGKKTLYERAFDRAGVDLSVEAKENIFRAGLNYKF